MHSLLYSQIARPACSSSNAACVLLLLLLLLLLFCTCVIGAHHCVSNGEPISPVNLAASCHPAHSNKVRSHAFTWNPEIKPI
jgi:hypothetical protein